MNAAAWAILAACAAVPGGRDVGTRVEEDLHSTPTGPGTLFLRSGYSPPLPKPRSQAARRRRDRRRG